MDPNKMASDLIAKMGKNFCVAVDAETGGDVTSVAAIMINEDGSIRVIGQREFYAEPKPDFDLDLSAKDLTGQRALRRLDIE